MAGQPCSISTKVSIKRFEEAFGVEISTFGVAMFDDTEERRVDRGARNGLSFCRTVFGVDCVDLKDGNAVHTEGGCKKFRSPACRVMDWRFQDVVVPADPKGAEFVSTWVAVKTDGILLGGCLEIAKLLAHRDDLACFGRKEFKVRPG